MEKKKFAFRAVLAVMFGQPHWARGEEIIEVIEFIVGDLKQIPNEKYYDAMIQSLFYLRSKFPRFFSEIIQEVHKKQILNESLTNFMIQQEEWLKEKEKQYGKDFWVPSPKP